MLNRIWWLLLLIMFTPTFLVQAKSLISNDPDYVKQTYLQESRVSEAWNEIRENKNIIIAVLDTGVDLDHPDLKPNLVPGYNLVQSGKPPLDNNGHGTATTGILAAVGNNGLGITGVLWKAQIMPIKILDEKGGGEAKRVVEGIRLAVDKGAKVILLSLRDPIYSSEMEKAVQYAEEKSVLLVAATGNDTSSVSYPAAFPTVLSVGAVDKHNKPLSYSNRGPEIDLVAPGSDIYTTSRDGKYKHVSGTSMAAPQVAGIAALLLKKNPALTPLQIRMILRGTAEDLGTKGWDKDSGYGMVNASRALAQATSPWKDIYEPNQTSGEAASVPSITSTQAFLSAQDSVDWYRSKLTHAGIIEIEISGQSTGKEEVLIEIYNTNKKKIAVGSNQVKAHLPKGQFYFRLHYKGSKPSLFYDLNLTFLIEADSYEDNDVKIKAVKLPAVSKQVIMGNFHKANDEDWFTATYPKPGKLQLEVKTDTLRMDPVLMIEQEGKWREMVDNGGVSNGQKESLSKSITPGTFFFQLKDYFGNSVHGEYQFILRYEPE